MRTVTRMLVARLQRDWTQAELASRVGVTQPRISGWETGRSKLPDSRREQIASILGLKPETLLDEVRP